MSEIAILVPVLRRPHRVAPTMGSVAAATTVPHRLLFIASPGEDAEVDALERAGADFVVVDWEPGPGDYARKINHGYRLTEEPYLFTGADDLAFHPRWAEEALARMTGRVGVVGTNDLGNPRVMRGLHSTHSLVRRAYADERGTVDGPGAIYHEGYPHEYVDNELVGTAKHRRAWAFARRSFVEHLHPNWGKAPSDESYAAEPERIHLSRQVYESRRHLWGERRARQAPPAQRAPRRSSAPAERPSAPVTIVTASLPERARLLGEAMDSVARQSVKVAHLVGVDAERGVAEVRNALVVAAATEWVGFLDDDDLLDAHHVAALLERAGSADVLIPHCRFDGPPLPEGYCNRPYDRADLAAHGIFPITVLARRQALLDAGAFHPEAQWEDWDLWNRMADAGARFEVVPVVTWTYRTRGQERRTRRLQAGVTR